MMIKLVYMCNTSIAGWHMNSRKFCRKSGATKLLETPVFIGKLNAQGVCVRIRMLWDKQNKTHSIRRVHQARVPFDFPPRIKEFSARWPHNAQASKLPNLKQILPRKRTAAEVSVECGKTLNRLRQQKSLFRKGTNYYLGIQCSFFFCLSLLAARCFSSTRIFS